MEVEKELVGHSPIWGHTGPKTQGGKLLVRVIVLKQKRFAARGPIPNFNIFILKSVVKAQSGKTASRKK